MRTRPLLDEQTKQSAQCRELGADLYNDESEGDEDEPAFGADPFDILAHRESQGEQQ